MIRLSTARLFVPALALGLFLTAGTVAHAGQDAFQPARKLLGIPHDSGFPDGHDPYNSMGCASDGRIYYVLSADKYDVGARMYCFDPKKNQVKFIADLTEACGEGGKHSIVQGKSHVNFVESNGKLFFATHLGF